MGAPEKIYIVNDDLNIKREWYKTKQVGFDTTEYTRTDAIIEKVCKFLDDRIKHDSIDYPMATIHLIEDIKKYMKG